MTGKLWSNAPCGAETKSEPVKDTIVQEDDPQSFGVKAVPVQRTADEKVFTNSKDTVNKRSVLVSSHCCKKSASEKLKNYGKQWVGFANSGAEKRALNIQVNCAVRGYNGLVF
jgi:hypothetical protein